MNNHQIHFIELKNDSTFARIADASLQLKYNIKGIINKT